jgi:hypothetical protein
MITNHCDGIVESGPDEELSLTRAYDGFRAHCHTGP